MSDKVQVNELSEYFKNYFNSYCDDITEDVIEITDQVTEDAKNELKDKSPRGRGKRRNPYWRGWSVKLQKKGKLKYQKVVWNRTNYQLTHLLEFGHVTRNGTGWVKSEPHIREVEDKYKVKFVDLLEKKIRSTK